MAIFIAAFLVLLADQISKHAILVYFQPGDSLPIISNVFHLSLVLNKGFAFGLFSQKGAVFIWCVYLVVIVLVILLALQKQVFIKSRSTYLYVSFIISGALGNFIDRVRFGAVVDFLDFRIWPVFNIADASITVGISLLVLQTLMHKRKGT